MSWLEFAAIAILLLGIGAGGYLVAQRPAFWYGLVSAAFAAALPRIAEYILRRNPPDIEAKMRECIRRGGEWDNFNKRCK